MELGKTQGPGPSWLHPAIYTNPGSFLANDFHEAVTELLSALDAEEHLSARSYAAEAAVRKLISRGSNG